MSIFITIIGLFITTVISFFGLAKENKADLIKFIVKVKNKTLAILILILPLIITTYFFYLSAIFIMNDSPIRKVDLFIAPIYLFNIFGYGGLSCLFYSKRKEIIKSFDDPKPDNTLLKKDQD